MSITENFAPSIMIALSYSRAESAAGGKDCAQTFSNYCRKEEARANCHRGSVAWSKYERRSFQLVYGHICRVVEFSVGARAADPVANPRGGCDRYSGALLEHDPGVCCNYLRCPFELTNFFPSAATMYMQDVLELICRKRKIKTPNDWALLSDDFKILIPLDRTVASLEGSSRLVLVLRSTLPQYGFAVDGDRRVGRTTDPNGSCASPVRWCIKLTHALQHRFSIRHLKPRGRIKSQKWTSLRHIRYAAFVAPLQKLLTSPLQRYTVFRKVPMLVARLERTLTIDGDYIYVSELEFVDDTWKSQGC